MTGTAQGTSIRCDNPLCSLPATIEEGVYGYCAAHAGKSGTSTAAKVTGASPAVSSLSRAHTPPVMASQPSPGMPTVVGGGTIGLLLEQASGHSSARVRKTADKIEAHLETLRELIKSHADDDRRRKAEQAAKEKARGDVARLEAELAAARAALRRKPVPPPCHQRTSDLPEGLRPDLTQPARTCRARTALQGRRR